MKKVRLHTLTAVTSLAALGVGEVLAAPQAGHDSHDAGGAGLPQLDPTWFPSQLFWLAITVAVLYFVFSKRVLPELSSIIENRRTHIQNDLDNAQRLKHEAEEVQTAYETILEEARQKSTAIFVENEESMKEKIATEYQSFQDRAAKENDVFERRIEKAKQEAMEEMNTIAAEIAASAAEKIVGVSTDMKKAQDAVKTVSKDSKESKAA